ncbi:Rhodanese-like domain-containing protein, partial [Chytriomyces sp. MP71]
LSLYSDFVAKVKPSVPAIQVEALDTLLREDPDSAKFHLLDVREPYEWNEERLPYAKYTGRGKLEVQIESLVSDQTDDILLYCSNGTRSMLAAEVLQQIGFKNAKYLSGGVAAWKEANKAVTKNMR